MRKNPNAERRLLVVCESLGIGGTETHLIRLLVPLAARGWDITVYCLSERGCRADQVERSGIRVLSASRLTDRSSHGIRNPASMILAANRLFGLMRRWRPQIAHFYLPGPYLIGAPVSIAAGTPIKIMSRRSLSNYQQHWPMTARVERFLHRRMDAVIGNSRAVVGELAAEGVPRSKIQLIYNGIESSIAFPERTEARRALGIEQETLVGVIVANLIPYKGHADLIDGLASVAQSLPPGWRVLCAGRDEGLQLKLEKLVEARGLKANVAFLGERSDVPALLAAADFGVLSSWEEGFSNVILESMAAGLPMIVTNVGGNPEAVLDGETGLVVAPRNPAALGGAVLRLAQDPKLRRRLGGAGLLRVRNEFSIDSCVEAHESLYERLLDERIPTARPVRGVAWTDKGRRLGAPQTSPKVTVVLPTYNRGEHLRAAAASVVAQSFEDFELLIVDDGSYEDIGAVLATAQEDPRVRIIRHPENRGTAAARNTGTSQAKGEYIAFLDSDDVWFGDKLARQLAWMESKRKPISCTGYRIATAFRPRREVRLSREVGFHDLQWGCVISPGSTMVARKDLLEAVGPFDESLRRLEDWEWLLRCSQITPIGIVPEILTFVQAGERETYPWEHVRDSAAIIEGYAVAGKYPLGAKERRVLRSTLHSEVAASAFRRRHYGSAAISLVQSVYFYPFKGVSYYGRLARAVKGDVVGFAERAGLARNRRP